MRLNLTFGLALTAGLCLADLAIGQTLRQYAGTPVQFLGAIQERSDLSAIGHLHSFLLVGSDEPSGKKKARKNVVQLLRANGENRYVFHSAIPLCKPTRSNGDCSKKLHRKEMDIEGIAVDGSTVYVVGSHAVVRKKVRCEPIGGCTLDCKRPRDYAENREILSESDKTAAEGRSQGRARLVRFDMDARGRASNMSEISLGPIIDKLPIFQPFNRIPSKENGVDIEGIAIRDGIVHVGFRGPVFRGNYVPVLKVRFDRPQVSSKDVVFVKLDGRGIRDLARVSDGFLILAGPVGDGSATYQLYHWDGEDMVPGDGPRPAPPGKLRLLGVLDHPPCASPEGVSVQREDSSSYDIIVVFDGAGPDVARRYKIAVRP